MVVWVLEREVFSDGDERLAEAARNSGSRVVTWRDEWWEDGSWPREPDDQVVFHGSLANADQIARKLPWTPGAYCSTERFSCSSWWPGLSDVLASKEFAFTTVAELVASGPPPSFGERVFVRPDSALKPFSGRVLAAQDISLAALDHGFYYDDLDLPVVVGPGAQLGEEWRFVVVDSEIVAGSSYVADGREAGVSLDASATAWSYAAELSRRLAPPDPAYVLDVCETDRGLRLLELNPFSGADLYDCDRALIVAAVERGLGHL